MKVHVFWAPRDSSLQKSSGHPSNLLEMHRIFVPATLQNIGEPVLCFSKTLGDIANIGRICPHLSKYKNLKNIRNGSSKLADHHHHHHQILLVKSSGLTRWDELCKTARCSYVKQCLLPGARPDFVAVFWCPKKTYPFIQKMSWLATSNKKRRSFSQPSRKLGTDQTWKYLVLLHFGVFWGSFFLKKNDWPDIIYCRRLGGCFELSPIFTFGFFAKIWGAMFCQAIKKWRVWACGGKKPPMRQFFCKKPFLGYSFPLLEVGSECGWLPSTPVAMQKKHHTIVVPPKKHRWKIFEILHKDVRKKQLSESCFTWKISGRALLVQLCYIFLEAFWMADFSWVW